jgi:hypothetical protein
MDHLANHACGKVLDGRGWLGSLIVRPLAVVLPRKGRGFVVQLIDPLGEGLNHIVGFH